MRTALALVVCALLIPLNGCSEEYIVTDDGHAATLASKEAELIDVEVAAAEQAGRFVARLSASEEVPSVDSRGRGVATFRVSADGNELSYRLIVAGLDKIRASHIHLAPSGQNGPVVAFLYGPAPDGGAAFSGILAEGTVTAVNLVGPLAGQPLSALVEQLASGDAYVNVHTTDFPSGEIRGQIR